VCSIVYRQEPEGRPCVLYYQNELDNQSLPRVMNMVARGRSTVFEHIVQWQIVRNLMDQDADKLLGPVVLRQEAEVALKSCGSDVHSLVYDMYYCSVPRA